MNLNGREINASKAPYIIAELSANHGGSIDRAKNSIIAASEAGVSAVKIQSYTPDTMTIKCEKKDFYISEGLWSGSQLYDLYKSAYTPFEWHQELFQFAREKNITLISTPFDESAVDLLDELNVPAFKIASFEIIDIPLIKYIAKKNRPILLSTGMANIKEINEAVEAIRKITDANLLLFHCISSYPTPVNEANLSNITFLKKEFKLEVGLSDHTLSNTAATVAIALGAVAIEKHFKLDDKECGPDSSFSLNIEQLKGLVKECNSAWEATGFTEFKRSKCEDQNLTFRRSLYFVTNLKKGQVITGNDIRRIRPGYGLKPKYYDRVIGMKVKKDIERGEPVNWENIYD